jgi:hypothetical protein
MVNGNKMICVHLTQARIAAFSQYDGPATCFNCEAGYGPATCFNCKAGKYSADTGSKFQPGSHVCTNCNAGKFSAAVGATSVATCSNCKAGKFSVAAGAGACDDWFRV